MRPVDQLTQDELRFLRQLWELYPAALGIKPERATEVDEVAVILVAEGYIERVEHTARRRVDGDELVEGPVIKSVSYRLAAEWASQFQAILDAEASKN